MQHLTNVSKSDLARLAGKFIVLDGPDGGGKTAQNARLADLLRDAGVPVETTRDPGGTAVGEGIRNLLLHLPDKASRPVPHCELLLFMASRAQLVAEVIAPALAQGKTVLCDRFVWATVAYQGANGSDVDDIMAMAKRVIGSCWPDLTIILDVPPEAAAQRISTKRGTKADAIEERSLVYRARVREIFLELPRRYPYPIEIVDATPDADTVFAAILQKLVSHTWDSNRPTGHGL